MGIIIGDTLTLDNGLTANNTYGSFGEGQLIVEKNRVVTVDENNDETATYDYRVSCKGSIWANKQYRDDTRERIHAQNISVTISSSELDGNLYVLLYTNWKSKYTTVSDSTD